MLWIALHFPHLAGQDEASARAGLEALAAWAGRFTPNVSLEGRCGLLLEVAGSLKLYGGLPALVRSLRTDLKGMDYRAGLAGAPTARAAWWLARAGRGRFVTTLQSLDAALAPLPLEVLECDDKTRTLLQRLGLRTLGELKRLPRGGLARRCGQALLDELDRARGRLPEARLYFQPPPVFHARQELYAEVSHTEPLLLVAQRLLVQLAGYLVSRSAGVGSFRFVLLHREARRTTVEIGLVAPSRDSAHLLHLLRERLARVRLREPVREVLLQAEDIRPLAGDNASLFHDEISASREWPLLVEQLRARLGNENIHGVAVAAEHRPEYASVRCEPSMASQAEARFGLRPLWLLPAPQALPERQGVPHYEGPLKLLMGPERIQSGWWDGAYERRDYFIAQTPARALLWIYRVAARGWYLHGWFA